MATQPGTYRALSRRDFLQATAVGTAGGILASCAREKHTRSEMLERGFIDAHVHVWTSDTGRYPLAEGFTPESMKPPSYTPDELFADCKPLGVTRIVLIQMSYYGFDNTYMTDMMRKHRGVFSGVAVIDENKSPRTTMEALAKQGVRGFRIYPALASGTNWLSGDGMQAMWKYGAEARLNLCPLIDTVELAGVSEMCDKFPDTPVVIDHFARLGIKGEIPESELKTLCAMSRHANVKVKASAFYALGKKKGPYLDLGPMIRRVLDAFGPDRVMWASDGPFQVVDGHNYRESVELIRDRLDFLSASDRDWLLRKTAAETFF